MGTYYSMISRRTRNVEGVEVAFRNFYGKAPGMFDYGSNRRWNTFCTKAENNADYMQGRVQYVLHSDNAADMKESAQADNGKVPIYNWDGQSMLHDGFWDKNFAGYVVMNGKKWSLELKKDVDTELEMV